MSEENNATVSREVGGKIKAIRKQLRLSQEELAAELGYQQTKLSRLERGETAITVDELVQITDVLGRASSHLLPRGDTTALSPVEEQLLQLFRQLEGPVRRAAAMKSLIELRDEQEYFAENMLVLDPAVTSSKFEQFLRWMGMGNRRQPASNIEPVLQNAIEEFQSGRDGEEPFYAPYSEEMEMREFKRLVLDIGHELREIYNEDRWDNFDCEKYKREISRIKRRYQR